MTPDSTSKLVRVIALANWVMLPDEITSCKLDYELPESEDVLLFRYRDGTDVPYAEVGVLARKSTDHAVQFDGNTYTVKLIAHARVRVQKWPGNDSDGWSRAEVIPFDITNSDPETTWEHAFELVQASTRLVSIDGTLFIAPDRYSGWSTIHNATSVEEVKESEHLPGQIASKFLRALRPIMGNEQYSDIAQKHLEIRDVGGQLQHILEQVQEQKRVGGLFEQEQSPPQQSPAGADLAATTPPATWDPIAELEERFHTAQPYMNWKSRGLVERTIRRIRAGELTEQTGHYNSHVARARLLVDLPWRGPEPANEHQDRAIDNEPSDALEVHGALPRPRAFDPQKAREVLDQHHEGMDVVKECIIDELALLFAAKGPIIGGSAICLVGPAGVGKTTIAESIAVATGRDFGRVALGGINTAMEIRGFEFSFTGAEPGRIVRAMFLAAEAHRRNPGCEPTNDPLIVLDEIDKVGKTSHYGDPSTVLMAALDPRQNKEFVDAYLEAPYDLSNVLFVATANDIESIPPALLDRMEVIQLDAYTDDEKFGIAKKHIVPRVQAALPTFGIKDTALWEIVRNYTQGEGGVRTLERMIRKLAAKTARERLRTGHITTDEVAEGSHDGPFTQTMVQDTLPAPKPMGLTPAAKLRFLFYRRRKDLAVQARTVVQEIVAKVARSDLLINRPDMERQIERGLVLLALPWKTVATNKPIDLDHVKEVLDEQHYGLKEVKTAIVDHIAVQNRTGVAAGKIMCLVGPPGMGKTSIVQSIAKAIGWEDPETNKGMLGRVALGGVFDEPTIRGVSTSYANSGPGSIIRSIRTVAEEHRRKCRGESPTTNPVVLLDEIDKLSRDQAGNQPAAAALLEVLDPHQNSEFMDAHLEVPYDLSNVMFIATANYIQDIPPPLRDRMEVIELDGYTEHQKTEIARRHIIPMVCQDVALDEEKFLMTDEALLEIIRAYTREAGVRQLKQKIEVVARKAARAIEETEREGIPMGITEVRRHLGLGIFRYRVAPRKDRVGVATGLVYTDAGGDLLSIEAVTLPGSGGVKATGTLGEVAQESVIAAVSYVGAHAADLGLDEKVVGQYDFHVHLPEGAQPKDGPSAGMGMVTAIVSSLKGVPVRRDVAMTGEVTLRGEAVRIGGLKTKLLAALRTRERSSTISESGRPTGTDHADSPGHGIRTVIIPEDNRSELDALPKEMKEHLYWKPNHTSREIVGARDDTRMEIIMVSDVDDAVKIALNGNSS